MVIFVALMINDILLLDFFNSLGLPTSTTGSIGVFSYRLYLPFPLEPFYNIFSGKQYDIKVYNSQGNKVIALTGNTINMSHLSSATYIVKALDKLEKEKGSYKVVKN